MDYTHSLSTSRLWYISFLKPNKRDSHLNVNNIGSFPVFHTLYYFGGNQELYSIVEAHRLVLDRLGSSTGSSIYRLGEIIQPLPSLLSFFLSFFFFFFCLFAISWATPTAYGGSQTRGRIRAVATSLHQSHSNSGSELRLQPTPQLMATPDP